MEVDVQVLIGAAFALQRVCLKGDPAKIAEADLTAEADLIAEIRNVWTATAENILQSSRNDIFNTGSIRKNEGRLFITSFDRIFGPLPIQPCIASLIQQQV